MILSAMAQRARPHPLRAEDPSRPEWNLTCTGRVWIEIQNRGLVNPILIVYATREGHTKRIVEYVAEKIRLRGISVTVLDARKLPSEFCLSHYSGVVIAASVHIGKHEKEISHFVKCHQADLNQMLTAFISVSLSQAGAQDEQATLESRAKAAEDVKRMTETFLAESQWRPTATQPVAGALMYKKYNFLVRLVMKRIARKTGASTDTSRDHVFTKWQDLDDFVGTFLGRIGPNVINEDRGAFEPKAPQIVGS